MNLDHLWLLDQSHNFKSTGQGPSKLLVESGPSVNVIEEANYDQYKTIVS